MKFSIYCVDLMEQTVSLCFTSLPLDDVLNLFALYSSSNLNSRYFYAYNTTLDLYFYMNMIPYKNRIDLIESLHFNPYNLSYS